ncbi:hypothetical protein DPMN_174502 [Dreissena polymorpha]|uniref:Uncharacterized protein n=1 Tax=Dreissena polymorpha TaxID=45954 RepID=A0A9D4E7K3_DREPO|nr:hypothetical protein DPMN_174502 [Dreissena polymorpha]
MTIGSSKNAYSTLKNLNNLKNLNKSSTAVIIEKALDRVWCDGIWKILRGFNIERAGESHPRH